MKKIVSSVVDVANIHNYSVAASIFFNFAYPLNFYYRINGLLSRNKA